MFEVDKREISDKISAMIECGRCTKTCMEFLADLKDKLYRYGYVTQLDIRRLDNLMDMNGVIV